MELYRFWEMPEGIEAISKQEPVTIYPEKLMVSLTSHCNLKCWHCIRSTDPQVGRSISREMTDYILRELVPHARFMRVGGNGINEQMISRQFDHFFENLDRRKLEEVHLITNLTVLTPKKAELVARKIDNLEISVEGTGEYFEKIRGFSWDKVLRGLELLSQARERHGGSLKITLLACVLRSHQNNLLELFKLKDYGVDQIMFRDFVPQEQEKATEALSNDPGEAAEYIRRYDEEAQRVGMPISITYRDAFETPGEVTETAPSEDPANEQVTQASENGLRDCFFPWSTLSINSEGDISCCCVELNLAKVDRNGPDQSFSSIWNSEKFVELRKKVNSSDPWEVCRNCEMKR